jgi:hypothetical protein
MLWRWGSTNMENGLLKMQSSSRPDKADNVLFLDFNSFHAEVAFRNGIYGPYPGFCWRFRIVRVKGDLTRNFLLPHLKESSKL